MLFNEPKLLKSRPNVRDDAAGAASFSALQRAEIAEILWEPSVRSEVEPVSVLFNEPKLLKFERAAKRDVAVRAAGFSALQRAEIAEIPTVYRAEV